LADDASTIRMCKLERVLDYSQSQMDGNGEEDEKGNKNTRELKPGRR
jgi:hypothetical protein